MSKTDSLHYQLCLEGAKWLHRQKRDINRCEKRYCYKPEFCWSCHRFKYVAVELITWAAENCDVWGLLYWNGNKIIQIKEAPEHKNTARTDLMILSSILRRENFPAKIYNYRHQNTTIKPQK